MTDFLFEANWANDCADGILHLPLVGKPASLSTEDLFHFGSFGFCLLDFAAFHFQL